MLPRLQITRPQSALWHHWRSRSTTPPPPPTSRPSSARQASTPYPPPALCRQLKGVSIRPLLQQLLPGRSPGNRVSRKSKEGDQRDSQPEVPIARRPGPNPPSHLCHYFVVLVDCLSCIINHWSSSARNRFVIPQMRGELYMGHRGVAGP